MKYACTGQTPGFPAKTQILGRGFSVVAPKSRLTSDSEIPGVQAGLRKTRGTRDQIANIRWIIKKARELQKNINLCFIDYAKAFDCVQFSSVAQLCPTLCDPMNCNTPGLPVHQQLLGFTQTRVHRVGDAIQPSHPLSSPSPLAFNLSQPILLGESNYQPQ